MAMNPAHCESPPPDKVLSYEKIVSNPPKAPKKTRRVPRAGADESSPHRSHYSEESEGPSLVSRRLF